MGVRGCPWVFVGVRGGFSRTPSSVGRSHNTEDITQLGFIYSSFFSSGVGQRVNKGTLYAVAGLLIAPRRLLHLLSRTPDLLWLPDENIVDRGSYTVPPFN